MSRSAIMVIAAIIIVHHFFFAFVKLRIACCTGFFFFQPFSFFFLPFLWITVFALFNKIETEKFLNKKFVFLILVQFRLFLPKVVCLLCWILRSKCNPDVDKQLLCIFISLSLPGMWLLNQLSLDFNSMKPQTYFHPSFLSKFIKPTNL